MTVWPLSIKRSQVQVPPVTRRKKKKTLHLAPNQVKSSRVGTLGWGRTRPLAMPNTAEGLRVPTPQGVLYVCTRVYRYICVAKYVCM